MDEGNILNQSLIFWCMVSQVRLGKPVLKKSLIICTYYLISPDR